MDRLVTWCSNMIINALERCAIARQSLGSSNPLSSYKRNKFAIDVFFETYCGSSNYIPTPTDTRILTDRHHVLSSRLASCRSGSPPGYRPLSSAFRSHRPCPLPQPGRRPTMGLSRSTKIYILLAIDVSFFFAEIITGHTKFASPALHPPPALTLPLRLCRGLTRPCRRLFPYA